MMHDINPVLLFSLVMIDWLSPQKIVHQTLSTGRMVTSLVSKELRKRTERSFRIQNLISFSLITKHNTRFSRNREAIPHEQKYSFLFDSRESIDVIAIRINLIGEMRNEFSLFLFFACVGMEFLHSESSDCGVLVSLDWLQIQSEES